MRFAAWLKQQNQTESCAAAPGRCRGKNSPPIIFLACLALSAAGSAALRADTEQICRQAAAYNAAFGAQKAKLRQSRRAFMAKTVRGRGSYRLATAGGAKQDYSKTGRASWYGAAFHGRRTANGEVFNMYALTAAHRTMPLPSYARVTNLKNGVSLIVRVNDRGPYAHNRIIDLSQKAAQMLGYHQSGLANVKVDYVGPAPKRADDAAFLRASYQPAARLAIK